ncbi:hypothetical protein BN1356_00718 [Streptococcus varani]|uniref:Uncharacterized protein n=1 Tax=Streptococcus varani TaxID=1608583 RepID=A0A0E4H4L8_9STRE|nr:hypothetical protein [Streptococcus varani]CQR24369.1 hypothetical protein BN1356_00718 [Streptococcus varani]
MTWNESYFSKFEFKIHSGYETVAILLCDVINGELSFQQVGNTGMIIEDHAFHLKEKQLSKLYKYIQVDDFEVYRNKKFGKKKDIVGYRDGIYITFRGISLDGKPILIYEMHYVYKDWYNSPADKLYDFISNTYFSDKKFKNCFISSGLMAFVCPN